MPFWGLIPHHPPPSGPSTATPVAGPRMGGTLPRPPTVLHQPQLSTLLWLEVCPVVQPQRVGSLRCLVADPSGPGPSAAWTGPPRSSCRGGGLPQPRPPRLHNDGSSGRPVQTGPANSPDVWLGSSGRLGGLATPPQPVLLRPEPGRGSGLGPGVEDMLPQTLRHHSPQECVGALGPPVPPLGSPGFRVGCT